MHVPKGEGGRGERASPPDFGRSEGAAGSGGAPHYYVPPQIFRLWTMPAFSEYVNFTDDISRVFSLVSRVLPILSAHS